MDKMYNSTLMLSLSSHQSNKNQLEQDTNYKLDHNKNQALKKDININWLNIIVGDNSNESSSTNTKVKKRGTLNSQKTATDNCVAMQTNDTPISERVRNNFKPIHKENIEATELNNFSSTSLSQTSSIKQRTVKTQQLQSTMSKKENISKYKSLLTSQQDIVHIKSKSLCQTSKSTSQSSQEMRKHNRKVLNDSTKYLNSPIPRISQENHNNAINNFRSSSLGSPDLFSSPDISNSKNNYSSNIQTTPISSTTKDNFVVPKTLSTQKSKKYLSFNENLDFSQLCNSSQILKQIDDAIVGNEKKLNKTVVRNSKRKSLEDLTPIKTKMTKTDINAIKITSHIERQSSKSESTDSGIDTRMTQMLRSVQSKKDITELFDNLEQSIYRFGSASQNIWQDDVLNEVTQESDISSLEDFMNKALKQNANKTVTPQTFVNETVVNSGIEFQELGPFYSLPIKVKHLIKQYKGIGSLYDWQDECLKLPAVQERKNLIYSLPTSGGKTLVAEILILREIMCRKKNVIFVLPYVAIVQEKVWDLSPFGVELDFLIEEYAAGKGNYPPKKRRYKRSVYVATTEKALGIINSLIELGRLEEIGMVVVDEFHLIGETNRGPVLEIFLTKLMYLNENIQIIGMSATISNIYELSKFLEAEVYTGNFRPVQLTEYVKCNTKIAKLNNNSEENLFDIQRDTDFSYSASLKKLDPDHLAGLLTETIPKGSCLIFCPTKSNCENVSLLLCKTLNPKFKEYKADEKLHLLKALEFEVGTLCNILKISVPFGIAYHHSGLTSEERKLIEEAFRVGVLSCICCTSTLAAGVNLPAKRVIIRKPYIGLDFISLSSYKQMIGRAGRAGYGELGESILICTPNELNKVKELLLSPMDETVSKMNEENRTCFRQLFLSCIGLGTANTKTQLRKIASITLLAVQKDKLEVDIKNITNKVIKDLFKLGLVQTFEESSKKSNPTPDITVCLENSTLASPNLSTQSISQSFMKRRIVITDNTKLVVSKLGTAVIKGGIHIREARILYDDLLKAQESLVLLDSLHLLYLVTPYSVAEQMKPNRTNYYNILMRLTVQEKKTAGILGINDSCIVRLCSNQQIKSVPERVLNRFFIALMLYDLWNERSIIDVSEKYQINRGIVQNLMTQAATFASSVVCFCEELEEFWAFTYLLKGISQRMAHCCCKELSPLMELPAVKENRARQLYNAGFKTLQCVAKADPNDLVNTINYMPKITAYQLIAAAKLLLVEKVESLREQAEDVMNGIENSKQPFPRPKVKK